MRTIVRNLPAVWLLFLFSPFPIFGQMKNLPPASERTASILTDDVYRAICINNVFNYYSNNGDGSFSPYTGGSGFEFPKGSSSTAIFQDGIVWAGYHSGSLKAGGSSSRHGLQAGRILVAGTPSIPPIAASSSDPHNRLYGVRRDVNPHVDRTIAYDILRDEFEMRKRFEYSASSGARLSVAAIYDEYLADWNEWPADEGAPFEDVNGNGVYEPSVDIPGVPGADHTMWHVSNDLSAPRTTSLYGSQPIGIEFQRTIWAHKSSSGLNNTLFVRVVLINKSGTLVDSMFIGQYADPDVGDAGDDFQGCDTTLQLAYAYNARRSDSYYENRPPAAGYVFLQTPIAPGSLADTAWFRSERRPGFRNIPLYAANGIFKGYSEPPLGTYFGTTGLYNVMHGLDLYGRPFVDPFTHRPSRFVHPGDPVSGTGWIDGISPLSAPGDRRVFLSAGPFTFADGDTQEVVLATIAEQGGDRLSAITLLRSTTHIVRSIVPHCYRFPSLLEPPPLRASELDRQLLLTWEDSSQTSRIESYHEYGYQFQGYVVRQLVDSVSTDRKVVAVYDRVDNISTIRELEYDPASNDVVDHKVIDGENLGVRRYFQTTTDAFTGERMFNGRRYTFSVSWYATSSSPQATPRHYESPPTVMTIVPQTPNPGDAVPSSYDAFLDDDRLFPVGSFLPRVAVRIVDPLALNGHRYGIRFQGTGESLRWSIDDSTTGATLFSDLEPNRVTDYSPRWNYSLNAVYPQFQFSMPLFDGLQASVNYVERPPLDSVLLIQDGHDTTPWWRYNILHESTLYPGRIDAEGATTVARAYDTLAGTIANAHIYEVRVVTPSDGSQYYLTTSPLQVGDSRALDRLPVQFWDVTANRRLIPVVVDHDGNRLYSTRKDGVGPNSGPSRLSGRSWEAICVLDPNVHGYYAEPLLPSAPWTKSSFALRKLLFINAADTSVSAAFPFSEGTIIACRARDLPETGEGWVVDTRGLEPTLGDIAKAKQDVNAITVYPNPYFACNTEEPNKYTHFVTLAHLPQRAVIRVFTLSGALAKTLMKDDPTQFARWDLTNEHNVWVSAGMYVIHIEMPDLGTVKILKLAVIPQTFIPDHY